MNLVPYFSLFKNTIIPTNDESSHRYYSKMESIVRPLLFIYSKTCSTRSKFNYHSNYSPSSTIIYVTRTLILKRRSAHRFYLDSISKVSLPNQYPTSSSLFKTTDARRSLEDLSKISRREKGKRKKKKKIPVPRVPRVHSRIHFHSGRRKFPGETWLVSRNLKGGFRFKMEMEIGGR